MTTERTFNRPLLFAFVSLFIAGSTYSIGSANSLENSYTPLSTSQITRVTNSNLRWRSDHELDQQRKPDRVLDFMDIAKNHTVLDLYAGGGWYTELFSLAVGKQGKVYAHNDHLTWRFGGKELTERLHNGRLKNVVRIDQVDLSEINVGKNSVDIAFMGINYHDLFFVSRSRNGQVEQMRDSVVDHKKALATIKSMLKDTGVLIISDHRALPGSGYEAANDLHRIDPDIVKHHLSEAGFELLEEAFFLANPNDDLRKRVFDPSIRWNTDRFIYKFVVRNKHREAL